MLRILASIGILAALAIGAFGVSRIPAEPLAAVVAAVLVDYTNDNRAEEGLSELATSTLLESAAQLKADDMAAKGYFAHVSPDGSLPWDWMDRAGYEYQYAGENLAVNFVNSSDVSRAWMRSPTHRANIVSERFTEIGIATSRGQYKGKDAIFVVQMFGSPVGSALAATTTAPTGPSALVLHGVGILRSFALWSVQSAI
jgi:uncharacterized protein YkwD